MKRFSRSIIASLALSLASACYAGDEELTASEVAATIQALGSSCGIEPDGMRAITFIGDADPFPGHQWSQDLSAGPDNQILAWFRASLTA